MTTAIVLAGRREGSVDPLAEAAGLTDKCLVPVAGRAMILHVLEALEHARSIDRILVSINDIAALNDLPLIQRLVAEGRLAMTVSRANLVDSVIDAVAGESFPVLITTADNVLLTPDTIEEIEAQAQAGGADVAVAFARRDSVLAVHPDGQRRFYRFRDDSYSNCNSYWIGTPKAMVAAEVFRSGGQFAKHPLRIVQALGLLNLVRFRFGIGTIGQAFVRFSRRFGLTISPVIVADGAVAIDVDNARTLGVAETIFADRIRLAA